MPQPRSDLRAFIEWMVIIIAFCAIVGGPLLVIDWLFRAVQ